MTIWRWPVLLVFALGVGNFAIHRAALERVRAMVLGAPPMPWALLAVLSLGVEFILLLISLTMVADGVSGWLWGYGLYGAGNGVAAWLLLRPRA